MDKKRKEKGEKEGGLTTYTSRQLTTAAVRLTGRRIASDPPNIFTVVCLDATCSQMCRLCVFIRVAVVISHALEAAVRVFPFLFIFLVSFLTTFNSASA